MMTNELGEFIRENVKHKSYFVIDDQVLNHIVNSFYDIPEDREDSFNFAASREARNGSQHLINVVKRNTRDFITDSWQTGWDATQTALDQLAFDDIIPPGNYLILVSW